jgi:hypothetical protein
MEEIKVFYESFFKSFNSISDSFEKEYLDLENEDAYKVIHILIKDLNMVIDKIKISIISKEYVGVFIQRINKYFSSLEQKIKSREYNSRDLLTVKRCQEGLIMNLKVRLK